jgi:hypothetical protein
MIYSRNPRLCQLGVRHYIPRAKKRQADPALLFVKAIKENFAVTRKSGILLPNADGNKDTGE